MSIPSQHFCFLGLISPATVTIRAFLVQSRRNSRFDMVATLLFSRPQTKSFRESLFRARIKTHVHV